mgnify:CR=1 FL=1
MKAGILRRNVVPAFAAAALCLGTPLTASAKSAVPSDFDAAFYAQAYPDVVAVCGTKAKDLYRHYVEYGKAEGRLPNAQGVSAADAQGNAAKCRSRYVCEYDGVPVCRRR